MKGFLLGLTIGTLSTIGITAFATQTVIDDGYILGWDVVKDGNTICSDPFIWTATREVECD